MRFGWLCTCLQDKRLALILAFDVVVEREAQHEADRLGIKIFTAEIIYHLFESFKKHQQEEKERLQREFASLATFPCRLEMIPDCVFNTRDPIVVGVKVTAGQLKIGTPLVARTVEKGLVHIGVVGSMELEHNEVPLAKTGQEVCIKIVAVGDKKLLGRHFEVTDELISKISRESIDAVKMYFKDDMGKADWKLFLELKKIYEII
jgi:translation initiation factor 5B